MCGHKYDLTPEEARLTKLARDGLSAEINRLAWAGIPRDCLRSALSAETGNFIALQDGPEAVGPWFYDEAEFHAGKAAWARTAETEPSADEKRAEAYIARARACEQLSELRGLEREAELALASMRPEIAAGVDTEFAKARKRLFTVMENADDEMPF